LEERIRFGSLAELKQLAQNGIVTPDTRIENENGKIVPAQLLKTPNNRLRQNG
jgi:hypothetical protein